MEVTLAVLADAANATENGRLNLLGVLQTIPSPVVPFQYPHLSLVLNIEATPLEHGSTATVNVRMIDQDGKPKLALPDHIIRFPGGTNVLNPNVNVIVSLVNVVFESYGTYRFDVTINGESLARVPLHVVKAMPSPVPPPQTT